LGKTIFISWKVISFNELCNNVEVINAKPITATDFAHEDAARTKFRALKVVDSLEFGLFIKLVLDQFYIIGLSYLSDYIR
jgi:hypothetical protein